MLWLHELSFGTPIFHLHMPVYLHLMNQSDIGHVLFFFLKKPNLFISSWYKDVQAGTSTTIVYNVWIIEPSIFENFFQQNWILLLWLHKPYRHNEHYSVEDKVECNFLFQIKKWITATHNMATQEKSLWGRYTFSSTIFSFLSPGFIRVFMNHVAI